MTATPTRSSPRAKAASTSSGRSVPSSAESSCQFMPRPGTVRAEELGAAGVESGLGHGPVTAVGPAAAGEVVPDPLRGTPVPVLVGGRDLPADRVEFGGPTRRHRRARPVDPLERDPVRPEVAAPEERQLDGVLGGQPGVQVSPGEFDRVQGDGVPDERGGQGGGNGRVRMFRSCVPVRRGWIRGLHKARVGEGCWRIAAP
ncbi:hypothetical protein O1L44_03415 [Streptomyces noursei]|nr:hypothetical protein [Streptomyces noursei]